VGSRLGRQSVEDAIDALVSQRFSTYKYQSITGHGGWYRRLGEAGTLGYVATSQMAIFASRRAGSDNQFPHCLKFLVDNQGADGGWPFVTNTDGVSTVDATAWSIMALSAMRNQPSLASSQSTIQVAIARGADYLRSAELQNQGWGLMAGTDWRVVSTALAIRALIASGASTTDSSVESGAQSLIGRVDPNSGGWCDSRGNLSIAGTATAILALSDVQVGGSAFDLPIKRAQKWLISIQGADSWGPSSQFVAQEEVDFLDASGLKGRIHYLYSRRPQALVGLSTFTIGPETCDGIDLLVASPHEPRQWSGSEQNSWTSWLVFDGWFALDQIAKHLPNDWSEIWWTPSRVVVSKSSERRPITLLRRYWPHLIVLFIAAATVWGIHEGGLVTNGIFQIVMFILSTTVLSVFANAISALILNWRRKK
jgi:hypothetical protein